MFTRELINKILAYKTDGTVPPGSDSARRRWIAHYNEELSVENGKLYLNKKPVVAAEDADTVLKKLYDDPSTTCNGRDRFYHRVQELYAGISKIAVMSFLKNQTTYQLHLQPPRGKKVAPVLTQRPLQLVQCDLIDMSDIASNNKSTNWILNIVDCFSKYLWSYPIKLKTAKNVARALSAWIGDLPVHCEVLQTDNGKEFLNKHVQNIIF